MIPEEFKKIESLENFLTYNFMRGELGWPNKRIAYEMDVNEDRLIEWINARRGAMEKISKGSPGSVRGLNTELRRKYITNAVKEKKKKEIDLKKVVTLFQAGNGIREIANALKVDKNDFREWWNNNLPVINQQIRKDH